MGLVTAKLQLSNPREPSLAPLEVTALADTGSVFLCIPEHVRLQLNLEALETREVKLADGSRATYPYVGPIVLRFKNRTGFVWTVMEPMRFAMSYASGLMNCQSLRRESRRRSL